MDRDTVGIMTLEGQQEVPLNLEMYQAAKKSNLSLSQYINQTYRTNREANGTAFEQMMVSSGLFLSSDRDYGMRPPTLASILDGNAKLDGSTITRNDGSQSGTVAGRILFPAVLLDILESNLRDNKEGYNAAFLEMVAFTTSVSSPKYDQVIIDHGPSQAARGQPIAQGTKPVRMLTLSTSSISKTMPVYSIGLEITEEAQAAATLDLVALALREHSIEERAAAINRDLKAIADGDIDTGYAGLGAITADSLDPVGITLAGELTQAAWVKYLRRKWMKRTITHIICDIDTYLAIEGRKNRPVKDGEPAVDERLNTIPRIRLPGIPGGVSVFTTETSILGANTLLGLDRSKAIRRMVYTGANYTGIQDFVMRKTTALRLDWSERLERAGYDEAFDKMTLTV